MAPNPVCLTCPIDSGLHETDEARLDNDYPDLPDILELFRGCCFGLAIRNESEQLYRDVAMSPPIQSQERHSFIMEVRDTVRKDTEMDATLVRRVKNLRAQLRTLRDVMLKWHADRFANEVVKNRMKTWSEKFQGDGSIHEELRAMLAFREILIKWMCVTVSNYPETDDVFERYHCQHQPPQPTVNEIDLPPTVRETLGDCFNYACGEILNWHAPLRRNYINSFFETTLESSRVHDQLRMYKRDDPPEIRTSITRCLHILNRWIGPYLAFWSPLKDLNKLEINTSDFDDGSKCSSWLLLGYCVEEAKTSHNSGMERINGLWPLAKSSGAIDDATYNENVAEMEFFGYKPTVEGAAAESAAAESAAVEGAAVEGAAGERAAGERAVVENFFDRIKGVSIHFSTEN